MSVASVPEGCQAADNSSVWGLSPIKQQVDNRTANCHRLVPLELPSKPDGSRIHAPSLGRGFAPPGQTPEAQRASLFFVCKNVPSRSSTNCGDRNPNEAEPNPDALKSGEYGPLVIREYKQVLSLSEIEPADSKPIPIREAQFARNKKPPGGDDALRRQARGGLCRGMLELNDGTDDGQEDFVSCRIFARPARILMPGQWVTLAGFEPMNEVTVVLDRDVATQLVKRIKQPFHVNVGSEAAFQKLLAALESALQIA